MEKEKPMGVVWGMILSFFYLLKVQVDSMVVSPFPELGMLVIAALALLIGISGGVWAYLMRREASKLSIAISSVNLVLGLSLFLAYLGIGGAEILSMVIPIFIVLFFVLATFTAGGIRAMVAKLGR